MALLLFAGTIFCSAFLLFLIQPIATKHILPWFGGSAAVWATCMSFFQVLLLAGYAYADQLSRRFAPRTQVVVHVALLVASAVTLQVLADAAWKPVGDEDPTLRILALLAASIGLPYFMLSSTGPLVQSWVGRAVADVRVYRLFSLSNLASLLGLLAYPFLIEPRFTLGGQAGAWSAVYVLYVTLYTGAAVVFWRVARQPLAPPRPAAADLTLELPPEAPATAPTARAMAAWFTLSALGSWLLVAVTNHLTRDVASIPFLWLLPLVLYLLTFVICFESDRWYRRRWWLWPVLGVTALCAFGLYDGPIGGSSVPMTIALYAVGLFLQCVFLHGELASMRPAPRHLTRFYLMLSLGGAVGGSLVSLVAPRVLPNYYELGAGYALVGVIALVLALAARTAVLAWGSAVAAGLCALFLGLQVRDDFSVDGVLMRNFYGTLDTSDRVSDEGHRYRRLYHGSVIHGEQYLDGDKRMEPTTYYGVTSGLGRAIEATRREGQRVGMIGLGAGTSAAYGRAGDVHRFYEINPQVIDVAKTEFTFLSATPARVETVLGDARLMLERESPQDYDVLAVDAFSGDSVPVHLITREAMALYLRHLRTGGIVAFHVTNRHLRLPPVVELLARDQGVHAVLVHDRADGSRLRATDWVLVARDAATLQHPRIAAAVVPFPPVPGLAVWTDDFNNLFDVLK
jgi:SAM-dependent methyltransferase